MEPRACSCRCTSRIRSGCCLFLLLTAVTFSLFGFILGIWADGFEKLQIVPLLIITPLTFLGGSFYSIRMLPPFWQTVTLRNPGGLSGLAASAGAFTKSPTSASASASGMIAVFLVIFLTIVWWIFKTGYRLKN